jgi:hypothetical protein
MPRHEANVSAARVLKAAALSAHTGGVWTGINDDLHVADEGPTSGFDPLRTFGLPFVPTRSSGYTSAGHPDVALLI